MNIPNMISIIRILLALSLIFIKPFSILFYVCYVFGGISDFLDGFIARKFRLESEFGALLDSIADFIFIIIILIVYLFYFTWSQWMITWVGVIVSVRLLSLLIGWIRYKTVCTLHTLLNKLSGLVLFIFPLFYLIIPFNVLFTLVCIVCLISASEELLINSTSHYLNRNIKSYFFSK